MAYYGDAHGRDIEEPLPCDTTVANSDQPISPTSATDENPDSIKDHEDDSTTEASYQAKFISLLHRLFTKISRFTWCVLKTIIWCLIGISIVPVILFYVFITGDTTVFHFAASFINSSSSGKYDKHRTKSGFIKKKNPTIKVKIHRRSMVTAIRLGCLVLVWLVLNLTIPNIKGLTLFGSLLWTWSLLVALILIGYPILILLYIILISCISEGVGMRFIGTNIEYYAEGFSGSITLIIYFTSILATWFLCIDTKNHHIHRYGTMTLVSFLVGAILNVAKSIVLLLWKTNRLYNKYEGKILSAGCQLYFHLHIMDQWLSGSALLLVSWWDWENYEPLPFVDGSARISQGSKGKEGKDDNERVNWWKNLPIENYMLDRGATLKHIDNVARYFANSFWLALTEHNNIPDIVPDLQRRFLNDERMDFNITTAVRDNSSMDATDSQLLLELLQTETSKEKPTYEDFEKWMVDGYKNAYAVGNRIEGAFEVMRILNRVMTTFIVVLVILIWLFITGLATTKVIVGLASIFLALSFVFGDACKTFFQGAIFSFVTHPFDVADRCIIDDKELKVKKNNILTTTFFEDQSKEIFIYPNSDLATKRIVLLHGERDSDHKPELKAPKAERAADLMDLVEFSLSSKTTSVQIESLQKNIERHLEDGFQSGVYKKSYSVALMEVGDCIKMCVHFEHVLNGGDRGEHMDSIEIRKKKQRSMFLLQLKKFLEEIGN